MPKRFVDSSNSIVSDNILLFTEEINLCDPYNKICRSSPSRLNKVLSRFSRFQGVLFFVQKANGNARDKTGSSSFNTTTA